MGEVSYLPLIEDMVWSYSRIECFNDCPYRFFLKYISKSEETDKFYASYGTFMHKLIERYYKGELTKEQMLEEYLTGFTKNVQGQRPKGATVENYIKAGTNYLRNFEPFKYDMFAVEKYLEFKIDGLNFVGIIDFLGLDKNGGYHIIDNKSRDLKPRSGRAKPTAKDVELDSMYKQLYLYAGAVKQNYGEFPKTLCFNCFRTGTFIEESFDKIKYNQAIEWAKKEISAIKDSDDFYPNRDFFACTYICGVNEDCVYDQMVRDERRRSI